VRPSQLEVIGDAVVSFMERPDFTTDELGPLSWNMAAMFSSKKASFQQKLEWLGARGVNWKGSFDI
jgi:hypothetical protein